jgi:hypothetical protein
MRQLKKFDVTTTNIFYNEDHRNLVREDACYTVASDSGIKLGKAKQTFVVDWQMQALELWDLGEKSKSEA